MRLRRLASHPRLVDDASKVPSAKMEAALEVIDEVLEGGHRALVFSQFTDHLALLRAELDARGVKYLYLDGSTKAAERTRLCASFQAHEAPLFLISLRAGGTGLNLTAADYVVHLDPWWNPAVEDQATDRAHRIGQTRAVTVVRLVVSSTIEEAVVSLHAEKRALAEGLLDGTDAAATLSVRQLIDLMKGASDASPPVPKRKPPTRAGTAVV
jgi:SNF2 family DNA or RNA helicase